MGERRLMENSKMSLPTKEGMGGHQWLTQALHPHTMSWGLKPSPPIPTQFGHKDQNPLLSTLAWLHYCIVFIKIALLFQEALSQANNLIVHYRNFQHSQWKVSTVYTQRLFETLSQNPCLAVPTIGDNLPIVCKPPDRKTCLKPSSLSINSSLAFSTLRPYQSPFEAPFPLPAAAINSALSYQQVVLFRDPAIDMLICTLH